MNHEDVYKSIYPRFFILYCWVLENSHSELLSRSKLYLNILIHITLFFEIFIVYLCCIETYYVSFFIYILFYGFRRQIRNGTAISKITGTRVQQDNLRTKITAKNRQKEAVRAPSSQTSAGPRVSPLYR